MLTGISKIDLINKYNPFREVYTQASGRKEKAEKETRYFCKEGDFLLIITKDAGEWMIVVAVENLRGERFAMRWENMDITEEEDFL